MFLPFFIIGLIGAIIAALPPSATNMAMVKYTADENLKRALHLGYGAALGETIISGLALAFGVLAQRLFEEHLWIQISFAILMGGAGIYFLIKREANSEPDDSTPPRRFASGLLLGALNIPMFIYWTALFSWVSKYVIMNENSPWRLIAFFLSAVFLGKLLILFLYGKLSNYMTGNFSSFKGRLNLIIGIVLICAAIGQGTQLIMD